MGSLGCEGALDVAIPGADADGCAIAGKGVVASDTRTLSVPAVEDIIVCCVGEDTTADDSTGGDDDGGGGGGGCCC